MKKILVIGAGAMGSAFCVPSLENKNDVTLIGTHLENQLIKELKKKDNFHPILQTKLPKELRIKKFSEMNEVLNNKPDIIVVGVSSLGIDWFIEQISKNFNDNQKIVLLTKGLSIFENKLITISEKIKILLDRKNFKNINISAVKGPCLAIGLANKIRTGVVIANPKIEEAEELSKVSVLLGALPKYRYDGFLESGKVILKKLFSFKEMFKSISLKLISFILKSIVS